MSRFIELTACGASSTKVAFNVDEIVAISPETFSNTCKIMIPGAMFEVQESYEHVLSLLNPH